MLSLEDLQRLSGELKIDRERIVREYFELLVLNELSNRPWSKSLVFKGGTALRLAYGSPRFSDGLDFSLVDTVRKDKLFTFATETSNKYDFKLRDTWEKRHTVLVEFQIHQTYLPQAFRLKIEISKRKTRTLQFELKLLKSPVAPFEVLLNVQTLESMLDAKFQSLSQRSEPRDLFDIWYISKKIDKPVPRIEQKVDTKRVRQTLNKYLPEQWKFMLDEIIEEIKRNR
jgi:predicted nucleotidyltransferase component of viral defense system